MENGNLIHKGGIINMKVVTNRRSCKIRTLNGLITRSLHPFCWLSCKSQSQGSNKAEIDSTKIRKSSRSGGKKQTWSTYEKQDISVYIHKFNYKRGGITYLFIFLLYALKVEIRDMLRYKKLTMQCILIILLLISPPPIWAVLPVQ